MPAPADTSALEALLIEEGAVEEAQLERARRIAGKLQKDRPVPELLVELGQLSSSEYERISAIYRSRLGIPEILRQSGALTEEGYQAFLARRENEPRKGERQLIVGKEPDPGGGKVTEEAYLRALSSKYGIPYVQPEAAVVDVELLSRASIPYLRRHKILPFSKMDGVLNVIMANPMDQELQRELSGMYGVKIKACCAPADQIDHALDGLESFRDSSDGSGQSTLQYREISDVEDDETGEGAVHIVDFLLFRAVQLGASDLHIEPLEKTVRVRVRVDGVLRQLTDLPKDVAPRITSRFKVLAGADITERRLHQDGRIFVKIEKREVDIRVSSYVSVYGETLVMRILDRSKGIVPLEKLGFQPRVLTLLKDMVLRAASGLALVTGPTGSGKTTTLYSFVDSVNDLSLKVISAEDPVEYVLSGITQCSVNNKTGPTFEDSLRAILRQDPDIIVVGEIRDMQTASLAVESALTGHKVFSTFHTEDAVGAVIRLLEMGVEPFLVASTLSAVIAQRLVRKLCGVCAEPAELSRADLRFLSLKAEQLAGVPTLNGAGCGECGGSGFRGRIGIHEVLMPDDDFRDAILRRAPSKELRTMAKGLTGFLTLQEDGLLKVLSRQTSLAEIADTVPRDAEPRSPNRLQEVASVRRMQ